MQRWIRGLVVIGLMLPGSLMAQTAGLEGRLHASRAELEALLAGYEDPSAVQGYSPEFRARARQELGLIRNRLVDGDFRVGDSITLSITGQTDLNNTFTVTQGPRGPVLELPHVGTVQLSGLLRSELQDALRAHVGRFIIDPEVYARTSIRLQVFGEVGVPGFHVVPSDALLTDVIMTAGGPTGNARQDDIEIKRGDDVIWDGNPLQEAIIEGRTIDQLSMRAGDRIDVPAKSNFNLRNLLYPLTAALSLTLMLTRIF